MIICKYQIKQVSAVTRVITDKAFKIKTALITILLNIRKFIFRTLLLYMSIILPGIPAVATVVRDAGLSLNSSEAYMLSDRQSMIYLNPAYAGDNQNRFFVEYGGSAGSAYAGTKGGFLFGLNNTITLGLLTGTSIDKTLFNNNDSPWSFYYDSEATTSDKRMINVNRYAEINTAIISANGLGLTETASIFENTSNDLLKNNLGLLLSWHSGNLDLGIKSEYAAASHTAGRATQLVSEERYLAKSQLSLTGGAKYIMGGSFKLIEGTVSYQRFGLNNRYHEADLDNREVEASLKSDGANALGLRLHGIYDIPGVHLFHIQLSAVFQNTSTTAKARSTVDNSISSPFFYIDTFTRKGTLLNLGFSDEMKVSKNIVWFAATALESESYNNTFDGDNRLTSEKRTELLEQQFSEITVPVIIGLEGQISRSWQVRLGLRHNIIGRRGTGAGTDSYSSEITESRRNNSGEITTITTTSTKGSSGSLSSASLGFSFDYERFSLDWLANIQFITQGPNFVSGSINDMSTALGFTYFFGDLAPERLRPEENKPEKTRIQKRAAENSQNTARGA